MFHRYLDVVVVQFHQLELSTWMINFNLITETQNKVNVNSTRLESEIHMDYCANKVYLQQFCFWGTRM